MSCQNALVGISVIFAHFLQILYWYLEAVFRFFVPPSMKFIDGEVILVTGATGGIGKEICRYIVKCGCNIKLVLWDINIEELHKLAEELKSKGQHGLKIFCYEVDISTRQNIDKCCSQVKKEVGSVTIIFNNAGIAPIENFLNLTNNQIENTIQVNFMSQLWIIRQFLPDMVDKNCGRIVNICSAAALLGHTVVPYTSSKFAVNGFTESLKAELADLKCDGIHCTTVYPYFTKTPMTSYLSVVENNKSLHIGPKILLEPDYVAQKAVDGMRREYEFVYVPQTIPLVVLTQYFMPNKLRKFMRSLHGRCYTFKNKEEQKRFTTGLVYLGER